MWRTIAGVAESVDQDTVTGGYVGSQGGSIETLYVTRFGLAGREVRWKSKVEPRIVDGDRVIVFGRPTLRGSIKPYAYWNHSRGVGGTRMLAFYVILGLIAGGAILAGASDVSSGTTSGGALVAFLALALLAWRAVLACYALVAVRRWTQGPPRTD